MVGNLVEINRLAVVSRRFLAPVALGASLFVLAGCEGILGGIQDLGQGSGCSFVANILPVCGEASINPNEQNRPNESPAEATDPKPVVKNDTSDLKVVQSV